MVTLPMAALLASFLFGGLSAVGALTDSFESSALKALMSDLQNLPPDWSGDDDPCGSGWGGITCQNSRIISIELSGNNISGQLQGDIGSFPELRILDLSYNKGLTGTLPGTIGNLRKLTELDLVGCGFTGPIPDKIGSLENLVRLSLNSNMFIGPIPPSLGNLSRLYWLDLADNRLSGSIPISNGSTPGLDLLVNTKHFHFGNNQLSGEIPPQLFRLNLSLIHLLFDNNKLTGSIPSTLGLVQSLEVIRLDRNSLTGPVPENFNNLTGLQGLRLSNNQLTGPLPNLTGMLALTYVDMSNNSFDVSDFPPWTTTLLSLTTLILEHTEIRGAIPVSLFSLPNLQKLILKTNQINGTLDLGSGSSNQLQLIDLQTNFIDDFKQSDANYNPEVILIGNPVCQESGSSAQNYCTIAHPKASYSTPPNNCLLPICSSNQISSPDCTCSYPFTGSLVFRSLLFSDIENSTYYKMLEESMMKYAQSHQLPVESVALSNPHEDSSGNLAVSLEIFPLKADRFNRTGVLSIGFALSNQTYKPPHIFGPFYFISEGYTNFSADIKTPPKTSGSEIGIIAGAAAGGFVLVLLIALVGVYIYRRKQRPPKATDLSNLFAGWDTSKSGSDVPQLKGARWFSLEEIKKYTNNFSEANCIGAGGYGKVYRGAIPAGKPVAIKRAQVGSMQGGVEFKNEIELLSRVHHKNLVGLVGFCFEQGEQLLVYEFLPNGNLKDTLTGNSGIRLDWPRRLRVALGAARGLAYLHELADPPIIHRDIKSTNILLDEDLNAKVSDFGLSKLMESGERGHISTQVKGTMGYLDPEYYLTQQLTEKSDVYSFGILILELVTARRPIERGKYIAREVKMAIDKTKVLYGLQGIIDPRIGSGTPLKGLENFIDLAMRCLEEAGADRPSMGEVVKEIERIMQLAGLSASHKSASSSASQGEEWRRNLQHPYNNEAFFEYSGGFPLSRVEPQ
ncbi:hypothetical protein MLD38_022847 [Melastoma candidum]|uniref:Uncharacterized protein n=1 Tax=Melastoma candidum TaxID=119954 RepID=A0ACB9QKM9_9MYRT|nr:hypothetical protein MLD38_022847 [Melastoma candidum]